MKVGLKWKVAFAIITLVALAGLFWKPVVDIPNTGEFLSEENIVNSDVAWILAAAGLVLLMTPGLSFFMVEWWVNEMLFLPCCKVLLP